MHSFNNFPMAANLMLQDVVTEVLKGWCVECNCRQLTTNILLAADIQQLVLSDERVVIWVPYLLYPWESQWWSRQGTICPSISTKLQIHFFSFLCLTYRPWKLSPGIIDFRNTGQKWPSLGHSCPCDGTVIQCDYDNAPAINTRHKIVVRMTQCHFFKKWLTVPSQQE